MLDWVRQLLGGAKVPAGELGVPARISPRPRRKDYYADDYDIVKAIGHIRPTPQFGGPTLVWHLALWPDEERDPQNVQPVGPNEQRLEFGDGEQRITIRQQIAKRLDAIDPTPGQNRVPNEFFETMLSDTFHSTSIGQYYLYTSTVDEQIRSLLNTLGKLGRVGSQPVEFHRIDPKTRGTPETPRVDGTERFAIPTRESLGFTIWWPSDGSLNGRLPGSDALRVRVQIDVHADFISISFYLDVSRIWQSRTKPSGNSNSNDAPGTEIGRAPGEKPRLITSRRATILGHISRVQDICNSRINSSVVSKDISSDDVDDKEEEDLLAASRYLYDDLWTTFCHDFGLGDPATLPGIVGPERSLRVFANFRGLVLPTNGLKECEPKHEVTSDYDPAFPGKETLARYVVNDGQDPSKPNEANAVVKAYWPFIRRVTPFADYKDFIACGVMGWRALYVTALGSPTENLGEDEKAHRSTEDKPRWLREELPDYDDSASEPVRYLFLTKGPPHRKQIGRIVERINTMGTMRFYALKDWHALRNAGEHIRMRGQELDRIIRDWTEGRAYIDHKFGKLSSMPLKRVRGGRDHDYRDEWIARYTRDIESRLLSIGAALDKIGSETSGGIHYRISRSRYYVGEFKVLVDNLRIGRIDTWLSYTSFVQRGLTPAFDFIDNLGDRLDGLRRRLQAVTEGIQTSALVAQASATRENTMELRKVANAALAVGWAAAFASLFSASYYGLMIVLNILRSQEITWPMGLAVVVSVFVLGVTGFLLVRLRR